jgi:(5-formylfuran-3-yl)methyl phosphate synthase
LACDGRWGPFLIDTWTKDGSTLLDHLSVAAIAPLVERCRASNIPVALAGSIQRTEMEKLLPLRPDWFAVRGAVCDGGRRQANINGEEVRHLADWLASCGGG